MGSNTSRLTIQVSPLFSGSNQARSAGLVVQLTSHTMIAREDCGGIRNRLQLVPEPDAVFSPTPINFAVTKDPALHTDLIPMEAVGLAVGIVGLAGAFKDIIDLLAMFSVSRELGRDREMLEARLDLEKAALLQWASSVRLLAADYDRRLDNPDIPLGRTMACIRQLFMDASHLRQRYGLSSRDIVQRLIGDGSLNLSTRDSTSLTENFTREFAAFQTRVGSVPKRSVEARFKWVIRDKGKFENFLAQLSYFNSKLRELVPIAPSGLGPRVENMKSLCSEGTHVEILHDGTTTLPASSLIPDMRKEIRVKILNRIYFRSMDDRRLSITDAYPQTFQWVLQPANGSTCPWSDLSEWLRAGSGIYWVSGKAGSGKSTLMRYLHDHQEIQNLLSQWAAGERLLVASHFFWNLGMPEQKKLQGLQRCILYQLLNHEPSLIEEALPSMFGACLSSSGAASLTPPTEAEMGHAFRFLQQSNNFGKVCLLIDGVDEYDGR